MPEIPVQNTSVQEQPRQFAVVTLFPELVAGIAQWGVTGRAFERGLCQLTLHNPRDHADDRHGTVDDRPYGGGPGMVMQAPILDRAVTVARDACSRPAKVLALTPQGRRFDDNMARQLATLSEQQDLVLIAGRYEGFDERFITESVDIELSIGDFVVSGGELPAMLVLDAIIRLLPDVLGHHASAQEDSFAEGLLDYPHYTRPEVYRGQSVPPVLLSGNHKAIAQWRRAQSLHRTLLRRPDLLTTAELSVEDKALLATWQLALPDN